MIGSSAQNCGYIRSNIGRFELGFMPRQPQRSAIPLQSSQKKVSVGEIHEVCSGEGNAIYVSPDYLFSSVESVFEQAGPAFAHDWEQHRFPVVFTPGLIIVKEEKCEEGEATAFFAKVVFDMPMTTASDSEVCGFLGGISNPSVRQGINKAVFVSNLWMPLDQKGSVALHQAREWWFNYPISQMVGIRKLRDILFNRRGLVHLSSEAILYYACQYQLNLVEALWAKTSDAGSSDLRNITVMQNNKIIEEIRPFMPLAEFSLITSLCRESLPPPAILTN
jgi:hypothetical protein